VNLPPALVAVKTLTWTGLYWTTGEWIIDGTSRPWVLFTNCAFVWHLNDSGVMTFLQCDPAFGFGGAGGTSYFVAENEADLPP
jgi:hypothetical protein